MVNHGQSWSAMLNHAQPCSTTFGEINHAEPWLIMVSHVRTLNCDKCCLNMRINHGPMSHCEKYCLHMKINHGQARSTMVQYCIVIGIVSISKSTMTNHVYFRVYNIYFRIYIPWVFNINAFGSMLLPRVHNPLGF